MAGTPLIYFYLLANKDCIYLSYIKWCFDEYALCNDYHKLINISINSYSIVSVCVCVCVFRATLEPYEGSQARGRMRAIAAGLPNSHRNSGSLSRVCDLHHRSQQCHIFNPLSEVRDWTHVIMDTSQIVTAEAQWNSKNTWNLLFLANF